MTDTPLHTYIKWTEKDRESGECPVPAGSEVTVWFEDGSVDKDTLPEGWEWGVEFTEGSPEIIAYMVHSMPKQPREFWILEYDNGSVDGDGSYLARIYEDPSEAVPNHIWGCEYIRTIHLREVLE